MDPRLNDLLDRRDRISRSRRVGSSIVSLLLHLAVVAFFVLAPALAARQAEPIHYTKVQIVPLKALGVPNPPPVRRSEPEPVPEPEEKPQEPAPIERQEESKPVPSPETENRRPAPRPPRDSPSPSSGEGGADRPAQRRGTPDGSPLGLAPFGSSQSGFDDPDFKYSYYTDLLLAIIGSHYLRPAIQVEVELLIHFRIGRDGTLYDVEIQKSSGYASFDQAGLSAVRSSTLPPLPVSYKHDSLGVSLFIR